MNFTGKVELEKQMLGIFLNFTNPSFAKESIFRLTQKGLKSAWFSLSSCRTLFEASLRVIARDQPLNAIELLSDLHSRVDDKEVYVNLLDELNEMKCSSSNLLSVFNALKTAYFQGKIETASKSLLETSDIVGSDIESAIAEAQNVLLDLVKEVMPPSKEDDELQVIMEDYLTKLLSEDSTPVYDTGLYDLDDLVQFCPKTLNILAGRPSMGKTAMAIFLLFSIALKHKKPCYIFSLEMAKEQLVERFLTMASYFQPWQKDYHIKEVDSWRLNQHKLSKLPSKKHDEGATPLTKSEIDNLYMINEIYKYHQTENSLIGINDSRQVTVTQIEMKCKEFMQKKKVDSLGLVVIDYVQEMAKGTSLNSSERSNEIASICRQLRDVSSRINSPILLLAQLNRGVEGRSDKRPTMPDLADSGGIEQSADTILMMYRDGYYNPDSPDKDIAELLVKKNRVTGVIGTAKFIFYPHECVFKNLVQNHDY